MFIKYNTTTLSYIKNTMENSSGKGVTSDIPEEIKGWSWGAFLLNWIWGIGNNTYIALLGLIPFANIILAFVLGVKGNEWAWRNKKWASVKEFKQTQRRWALVAVGIYIFLALAFALIVVIIPKIAGNADQHTAGVLGLTTTPYAMEKLGPPLAISRATIGYSGGEVTMQNIVKGTKASGIVYSKLFPVGLNHKLVLDDSGEVITLSLLPKKE